jgi:hypothetical protein
VAEIYVVITGQAEGNDRDGFRIAYYWSGQHFATKPEAVSHGFEIRGSDDFNIGLVRNGELVSFWWMDHQIGETAEDLARIGRECGLERLRAVARG